MVIGKVLFLKVLFLSCLFKLMIAYRHEKLIHATLTPDRCVRNTYRLNDCNWCYCENTVFKCKARVCNEIDMFGHFNDAIQDLHIGMEGHGVWRSKATVCEPGVQYEKHDLVCICTSRGTWPNPICRDTFRLLHDVEINDLSKVQKPLEASNSTCEPTKLYLVGCNVCYCPDSGKIDTKMCTKMECEKDDPTLQLGHNEGTEDEDEDKYSRNLELYAECSIDTRYNIGCKKCVCLRNNRLVCDECYDNNNSNDIEEISLCYNKKVNEVFQLDCNFCSCDDKGSFYCTTNKCLRTEEKYAIEVIKTSENNLRTSNRPIVDTECVPGTSYGKDCNQCFCNLLENGKKTVGCTLKYCKPSNNMLDSLKNDCVEGTVYKKNCLKCRCDLVDGEKRETCLTDSKCTNSPKPIRDYKLESMNGYCEPQHTYKWNCNTCRCLSDGATVVCTSKVCSKTKKLPVVVDLIPVKQGSGLPCPKGHVYEIGCNVCFCLANGNVLCTTKNCG